MYSPLPEITQPAWFQYPTNGKRGLSNIERFCRSTDSGSSRCTNPDSIQFSLVQFNSVQDGIYVLGKAHIMCSTPSLRSFPNVAFETSVWGQARGHCSFASAVLLLFENVHFFSILYIFYTDYRPCWVIMSAILKGNSNTIKKKKYHQVFLWFVQWHDIFR